MQAFLFALQYLENQLNLYGNIQMSFSLKAETLGKTISTSANLKDNMFGHIYGETWVHAGAYWKQSQASYNFDLLYLCSNTISIFSKVNGAMKSSVPLEFHKQ